MEKTPGRYSVAQEKSIFSLVEVRQEKIVLEGELQVEGKQRGFSISQGDKDKDIEQQKEQRWAD